ncbi:aldehyde dehydrogenase [Nocardia jiangxiensis]|uniref:aldehyde dehydrogenase (NAD(+)) n=1 Tax=Nocardia jiangxiensis TaxID=282685 RepID=A0ABW6S728_9NOCA
MPCQRHLFIGGEWVVPSGGDTFEVISPHTGQPVAEVPAPTHEDVDRAISLARTAFDEGPWPRLDPQERVAVVRELAERYRPRQEELAQLVTTEMGAPITFSRSAHARLPGAMIGAFADVAARHPWREVRAGAFGGEVMVHRAPVGVVAAIIPWNMPMFLTVAKLVPALLAGCAVVLKPSPETALDAYFTAELLTGLGLPPGLVSILPGDREIGRYLVSHPGVDKVSFTGSTAAGRQVAAACGSALRRVSLELGGKSAAVVLDDADPQAVAEGMTVAGLMNSGQACVAQTRVLLPRNRYREFADALASTVESLPVGDPFDPSTRIGPMVSQRQQQRVQGYIDQGVREGARLLVGGPGLPEGIERGWYVRPTLFTDADNAMRIAQEEIFGPVLTLIPHDGDEEAIRLANATEYGLSGSIWSPDITRATAVAHRIRSGTLGINAAYSMDPAAPFGGIKASGIGREFGPEGLDGFLETTSLSIAPANDARRSSGSQHP